MFSYLSLIQLKSVYIFHLNWYIPLICLSERHLLWSYTLLAKMLFYLTPNVTVLFANLLTDGSGTKKNPPSFHPSMNICLILPATLSFFWKKWSQRNFHSRLKAFRKRLVQFFAKMTPDFSRTSASSSKPGTLEATNARLFLWDIDDMSDIMGLTCHRVREQWTHNTMSHSWDWHVAGKCFSSHSQMSLCVDMGLVACDIFGLLVTLRMSREC